MNRFVERIPNYIGTDRKPDVFEFSTSKELIYRGGWLGYEDLLHHSIDREPDRHGKYWLIVTVSSSEHKSGETYLAAGYIDSLEGLDDLPSWRDLEKENAV